MGRQEYQTQATLKAELMVKDGSTLDKEMAARTTAPAADDHTLDHPRPYDHTDIHGGTMIMSMLIGWIPRNWFALLLSALRSWRVGFNCGMALPPLM